MTAVHFALRDTTHHGTTNTTTTSHSVDPSITSAECADTETAAAAETPYDSIADVYDLVYEDWPKAIRNQAQDLHAIISSNLIQSSTGSTATTSQPQTSSPTSFHPSNLRLLDSSCGIGTQLIGLSELGYRVSGCDISAKAVHRCRQEVFKRGLDVEFLEVADMKDLESRRFVGLTHPHPFSVATDLSSTATNGHQHGVLNAGLGGKEDTTTTTIPPRENISHAAAAALFLQDSKESSDSIPSSTSSGATLPSSGHAGTSAMMFASQLFAAASNAAGAAAAVAALAVAPLHTSSAIAPPPPTPVPHPLTRTQTTPQHPFHVVLSADNSIAHLLSRSDLLDALRSFYDLLTPNGLLILTMRDYEKEPRVPKTQVRPYGIRQQQLPRRHSARRPSWASSSGGAEMMSASSTSGPAVVTKPKRYMVWQVWDWLHTNEDQDQDDVVEKDTGIPSVDEDAVSLRSFSEQPASRVSHDLIRPGSRAENYADSNANVVLPGGFVKTVAPAAPPSLTLTTSSGTVATSSTTTNSIISTVGTASSTRSNEPPSPKFRSISKRSTASLNFVPTTPTATSSNPPVYTFPPPSPQPPPTTIPASNATTTTTTSDHRPPLPTLSPSSPRANLFSSSASAGGTAATTTADNTSSQTQSSRNQSPIPSRASMSSITVSAASAFLNALRPTTPTTVEPGAVSATVTTIPSSTVVENASSVTGNLSSGSSSMESGSVSVSGNTNTNTNTSGGGGSGFFRRTRSSSVASLLSSGSGVGGLSGIGVAGGSSHSGTGGGGTTSLGLGIGIDSNADDDESVAIPMTDFHTDLYDFSLYIVEDDRTSPNLSKSYVLRGRSRAWTCDEVLRLMREAGFVECKRWKKPGEGATKCC
ncbi:hypothetical protein HDU76_001372 [Blyttiomyces sp. JEL0837]|nr:hypothetical protein HDU76_001372 [Blyttiomyces sp. JEL0837]